MNTRCTALLAACLLAVSPLAAAKDTSDSFEQTLARMSPEEKAPLAKMLIAQANSEFQNSARSDPNIEQARISHEADNTIQYTLHMRHSPKVAKLLANSEQRQQFGQFFGSFLKQNICSNKNDLQKLSLVGLERIRIQIHHDRKIVSDSSFAIRDCL